MDSQLPPGNTPPPVFNAPPPPPPPPLIPPAPSFSPSPAPRPQKSGTGWKVLSLILFLLLIVVLAWSGRQAVRGFRPTALRSGKTVRVSSVGPRLQEVTIKESSTETTNKIAVIPIQGVISSSAVQDSQYSMVTIVKEELELARKDDDVKVVILKVDSPGGEVMASDEIANAIKEFSKKSGKPVVVSMGSLAASGGYYVSVPCDWIVANELTITGSIGVIMHGFNYRGLLDKIGVEPEVFKSGKFKDMLSPTKKPDEITQEEKDMVQNLINETYEKFKTVVSDGRHASNRAYHGRKLSTDWTDYADGRILSGKQAYQLGFVDEIGNFDTTVDRAKKMAGIKHADVVEYQEVFAFANFLRLFGESATQKTVKVDIGIDIPKLRAGYPYYLSPNYVH